MDSCIALLGRQGVKSAEREARLQGNQGEQQGGNNGAWGIQCRRTWQFEGGFLVRGIQMFGLWE